MAWLYMSLGKISPLLVSNLPCNLYSLSHYGKQGILEALVQWVSLEKVVLSLVEELATDFHTRVYTHLRILLTHGSCGRGIERHRDLEKVSFKISLPKADIWPNN